jgi:hypothetical protein
MSIVCLGWGSLVWNPGTLPLKGAWSSDGPYLPIEFTRQSSRNRITLVLTSGVEPIRSLWAPMDVNDLDAAKLKLAEREGIEKRNIPRAIGYWAGSQHSGRCADIIGRWALSAGLDAVVWTNLSPKFGDEYRVPTAEEVLSFLRTLQDQGKSKDAEEYIRKAPRQVATSYRARIEAELGWTPTGEI